MSTTLHSITPNPGANVPKKRLGQHFLFDPSILRRIAAAAGELGGATVLEVGPGPGGLTYLGKVGTGFDDAELGRLTTLLAEHRSGESPFSGPVPEAAAVFTAPAVVGEVRYAHRTVDGLLRHPSWRGLRPDLSPADVVLEA